MHDLPDRCLCMSVSFAALPTMDRSQARGLNPGRIARPPALFIPAKTSVESLRLRVPPFRPNLLRMPVGDDVFSCCWHPPSNADYLQTYHCIIRRFPLRLVSTDQMDRFAALTRPASFEFWDVECSLTLD